jgi:hypothetical protein
VSEEAGLVNVYVCEECGFETVTKNRDAGTTPFMISCRNPKTCGGFATSKFYRVSQTLVPMFLWIKPTADELARTLADYDALRQQQIREHVQMGGLLDVLLDGSPGGEML